MKLRRFIKITALILLIGASMLVLTGCPSVEELISGEAVIADIDVDMVENVVPDVELAQSGSTAGSYELSRPENAITSIEVVNIYVVGDIGYDDVDVVSDIDARVWSQFLADLYSLECNRYSDAPADHFEGIAYRITYKDGSYELISAAKSAYCNTYNGMATDKGCYFDEESFEKLEVYSASSTMDKDSNILTKQMIEDFVSGTMVQDGTFVTDNETPLREYDIGEYELSELYDYFGEYPPVLYNIINYKFDYTLYSPQRVNYTFPIRCVRSITMQYSDGTSVTRYYTVYKVKEGGYFYVFWNISYGELRICYASYLPEVKSIEDFDSLTEYESTFEDAYTIDPSADFRMSNSGPRSYHLLTTGELLKIEYEYTRLSDTDDLIVTGMEVLPEDNDIGYLAQVYEGDLPK